MHQRVTLRAMTDQEYRRWRASSVEGYAAEMAAATGRDITTLHEQAAIEFEQRLPDGPATEAHWLLTVEDADGDAVGSLWLGPQGHDADGVFVFDIEIAEHARDRGLGRAAMLAAQDLAIEQGRTSIALNVFGPNSRARHLYDSLGYEVVSTAMRKQLGA